MYSKFQLAKKYFRYCFTAANGKGHGVHSPFVFAFIKFVMNDKKHYHIYDKAEALRNELLNNDLEIDVEDFGAGSSVIKTKKRKIKDIAASSLKAKKYSRLLFRMVQYYGAEQVLELGTSFGITTVYLASAGNKPVVITMEGSLAIAGIAQRNFDRLEREDIRLIPGDFDQTLPGFLSTSPKIDLVFLDGNHRKEPTLKYFSELLRSSHENTIMVFDDIHWSREMEEAWQEIKQHASVTLTIDLFFIGIVFFREEFKVKQHFTIRF